MRWAAPWRALGPLVVLLTASTLAPALALAPEASAGEPPVAYQFRQEASGRVLTETDDEPPAEGAPAASVKKKPKKAKAAELDSASADQEDGLTTSKRPSRRRRPTTSQAPAAPAQPPVAVEAKEPQEPEKVSDEPEKSRANRVTTTVVAAATAAADDVGADEAKESQGSYAYYYYGYYSKAHATQGSDGDAPDGDAQTEAGDEDQASEKPKSDSDKMWDSDKKSGGLPKSNPEGRRRRRKEKAGSAKVFKVLVGPGLSRHEDASVELRHTDMAHVVAVLIGVSLMVWRNSLQVVSLASSLLSGLTTALIVQAREAQHEQIFGIYFSEKDTWAPPVFGLVVAVVSGACLPYRRQVPILYAQAVVLFQVGIMRLMDISPVSLDSSGKVGLSVYCIASVCVLVASLPLGFRLVQSHQDDVCAFSTLQLGLLLNLSAGAHFWQRGTALQSRPYSPVDDYFAIFQQIRDSRCLVWDVAQAGDKADEAPGLTLCSVGAVCRMVLLGWIGGSFVLFLIWLVCNRSSDRGNYTPVGLADDEDGDSPRGQPRVPEPTMFGKDDDDFWAKPDVDDWPNDYRELQNLQADLQNVVRQKAAAVANEDFPAAKALKRKADEIELMIMKLKSTTG